jgi:hypothetical protein
MPLMIVRRLRFCEVHKESCEAEESYNKHRCCDYCQCRMARTSSLAIRMFFVKHAVISL